MKRFILACLLALSPVLAQAQPRHIYRDGNYFFCPYPGYDPYCQLPNDYSWALYGPPWQQRPPVVSVPVLNSLLRNTLPPVVVRPPPVSAPPEPRQNMDESRERVIRLGEEHCRTYPRDKICHPPR